MKLFHKAKDGGQESNVTGYWLIEWKDVFSIVLLKFSKGSREAYHTHAFNAISWVLKGKIEEQTLLPEYKNTYTVSLIPIFTPKQRLHKVLGVADSTWVLSFRGPWADAWYEYFKDGTLHLLTHGRKRLK